MALAFAACVATEFKDAQFTCDPAGDAACPPGLVCAKDGVCRAHDLDEAAVAPPPADGGSPEAASVDAGTPEAALDACASATWATFPDARVPFDVTVNSGGRLFTCGLAGSQGWLAEIDRCDGKILRETTIAVPGYSDPTQFHALVAKGTDLVVGGSIGSMLGVQGTGIYARYDADTFAQRDLVTLPGALVSDMSHAYVTSDGAVWLQGLEHIFEPSAEGWVVRVTDAGVTQLNVGTDVNGLVDRGDGTVYLFTDHPVPQVELFDSKPSFLGGVGPPITVGMDASTGMLRGAQGLLYAAGTADGPNDSFGYVGVLDLDGGTWTTVILDPNPTSLDPLGGLAMDTTSLFVGINQRADLGNGTPTIYRIDLPLTATSKPVWSANPFGATVIAVRNILVDAEGVFVVGADMNGSKTGGVSRCDRSGKCGH
jgi:hypothetical protein